MPEYVINLPTSRFAIKQAQLIDVFNFLTKNQGVACPNMYDIRKEIHRRGLFISETSICEALDKEVFHYIVPKNLGRVNYPPVNAIRQELGAYQEILICLPRTIFIQIDEVPVQFANLNRLKVFVKRGHRGYIPNLPSVRSPDITTIIAATRDGLVLVEAYQQFINTYIFSEYFKRMVRMTDQQFPKDHDFVIMFDNARIHSKTDLESVIVEFRAGIPPLTRTVVIHPTATWFPDLNMAEGVIGQFKARLSRCQYDIEEQLAALHNTKWDSIKLEHEEQMKRWKIDSAKRHKEHPGKVHGKPKQPKCLLNHVMISTLTLGRPNTSNNGFNGKQMR